MPPQSISTWNGNDINSASLRATLVNGMAAPGANVVFIEQPNADAVLAGTYTVEKRNLDLHIRVLDYANRKALREQLMLWFKRGTRGLLVGRFDDGADYQMDCQVGAALEQSVDDSMVFIAHLESGATAWRAVTADTDTWSPSGASSNKVITVGGTDETMLSISLTSVTAPAGVYLYQNIAQLINTPGIAHGLKACCIVLDTAALVTAGKVKADLSDLRIIDAGVSLPRYISDANTDHTHIWFVVNMAAGQTLTLNPGVAQIETATATGTITLAGNAQVVVTAAGMTGSPKTFNVAVALNDTAAQWATKVKNALAADGAVTARFAVSVTNNRISLTRLVAAVNDSTLNIALANGTCTGITAAPTSSNTQAGSAYSIAGAGNITSIEWEVSTATKRALAALPQTFIVVHGTEWMQCKKTATSLVNCKTTVVKREAFGTVMQAHAGGDVFSYIQHPLVMYYGNEAATDPSTGVATYNNNLPLFDLAASDMTQATWLATSLFYVAGATTRPGAWTPFMSRLGANSKYYAFKGAATSGDPALGSKAAAYLAGSWKSDTVSIGWKFGAPGGIRRITCTGRKYRSGTNWPATAELQCSANGSDWTTVFSEATPSSAASFQNWSAHTNVDIDNTSKMLRLILAGVSGAVANSYQLFEALTFITYWTTANIPSLTLLGEQSNHHLAVRLNNVATAGVKSVDDSIDLEYPMKLAKEMVIDGEAHTLTYEGVNAHGAMNLDDESRTVFIRLLPGSNSLTLSSLQGVNMGSLTGALSWYKRRL